MAGGAYSALSGLRTRIEQLDRLAGDIANAGTSGYKSERTAVQTAQRPTFDQAFQSAVDVAPGETRIDMRAGSIATTGRDLDLAIDGFGFFTIDTPAGPRYTRNGHFARNASGELVTEDGFHVLGDGGPISLGEGAVTVEADGRVRSDGAVVGTLQIVQFADPSRLSREDGARFRVAPGAGPEPVENPIVRGGSLEASNVSLAEHMVTLTELTRSFEALQRGVTMLMTDIDGRAINELGRK